MNSTAIGRTRGTDYIVRVCRKLNAANKTHVSVLAAILGLIARYTMHSSKQASK
jgi:hypothetical protein